VRTILKLNIELKGRIDIKEFIFNKGREIRDSYRSLLWYDADE